MDIFAINILPLDPAVIFQWSNVLLGSVFVAFFLNVTFYKDRYSFFSLEGHRYKIGYLFLVFGFFYFIKAMPIVMDNPVVRTIVQFLMACFSVATFFYLFYFWRKDGNIRVPKDIEDEINTRYLIEDKLINKNKQLEWAERTAKICYCSWDVNKNEIVFSDGAEDVMGIDPQQVFTFKDLKALAIPEDRIKIQHFAESIEAVNEIRSFLFRIIAGSALKYIQINAAFYSDNGVVHLIRGTFQDVTEQQMFIKRIEDKNETLKQIAWMQSHDVRGPVATLLGLVSLIDESELTSEHNQMIVAGFKEATENLDHIIKKIVKKAESAKVDI